MTLDFIKDLKNNPIFAMSLSGKELFHSNVLAWAFEKDISDANFDSLKKLFGIPENEKILAIFREKENFDVLIVYGTQENPSFVVIENKFKSIPEKSQFDKYSDKLKKGFTLDLPELNGKSVKVKTKNAVVITKFVFAPELTLNFFYDQIKSDGWKEVSYEKYIECIQKIQPKDKEDRLILHKYADTTATIIGGIINPILSNDKTDFKILPDGTAVKKLSEIRMHDLYIKMWYSKALAIINKTIKKENYDYCATGFTRSQGLLDWKKTVVCKNGKLYAGVQIQDKSFRITVEPYFDLENPKEKYSFKNKINSSKIYKEVADWENKILEKLSKKYDFFIEDEKNKERTEPYKYSDFKYMKYDMKKETSLSELAKAVVTALKLICEESKELSKLNFEFAKKN